MRFAVFQRKKIYLALFLLSTCAIFFVLRDREPQYHGKPLSHWLQYLGGKNGEKFDAAADAEAKAAIRQAGSKAIPLLLREIQVKDSEFKLKSLAIMSKLPLIKLNFSPASERHQKVLWAFDLLRDEGRHAIPDLIEISRDPQLGTSAGWCLYGIGSNAVIPLTIALTNSNREIRGFSAWILGQFKDERAIGGLIATLHDPDPWVRGHAAFSLGLTRKNPQSVVPLLIECLSDADPDVRNAAIIALGKFGPQAREAFPALLVLLKSKKTSDIASNYTVAASLKEIDAAMAAQEGVK